jgi:hypothetical protein
MTLLQLSVNKPISVRYLNSGLKPQISIRTPTFSRLHSLTSIPAPYFYTYYSSELP